MDLCEALLPDLCPDGEAVDYALQMSRKPLLHSSCTLPASIHRHWRSYFSIPGSRNQTINSHSLSRQSLECQDKYVLHPDKSSIMSINNVIVNYARLQVILKVILLVTPTGWAAVTFRNGYCIVYTVQ